ncbi:MAG: YdcF family protein [Ruminococcaceae bacterium]|nr:YdcF family protein [Oscillospiraceae bacterium]
MSRQKVFWYLAAVCAVAGTLLNRVSGVRFTALLFWCACGALICYAFLDLAAAKRRWAVWCRRILTGVIALGFAFFLVIETIVLRGAQGDADGAEASCVLILGAGVNGTVPSLTLRTRLDAALDYLADKPDIPVIVSGCQGQGEDITEAECMARYLTAHGLDASRIRKEERATSTRTNFVYTLALLPELGIDPAQPFVFVTSDYHVARANYITKKLGMTEENAHAVAAKMPRGAYYALLNANFSVREAFALANEMLLGVDLDI